MKKIMLGTSDKWSTSHLSQQPSEPAYYVVDLRILGTNHEVEGRNRKCRLLFLRQTIMVKGFVSKKAGSHKLKAFSRARVELEKWH